MALDWRRGASQRRFEGQSRWREGRDEQSSVLISKQSKSSSVRREVGTSLEGEPAPTCDKDPRRENESRAGQVEPDFVAKDRGTRLARDT